jgi:hypothetical protein
MANENKGAALLRRNRFLFFCCCSVYSLVGIFAVYMRKNCLHFIAYCLINFGFTCLALLQEIRRILQLYVGLLALSLLLLLFSVMSYGEFLVYWTDLTIKVFCVIYAMNYVREKVLNAMNALGIVLPRETARKAAACTCILFSCWLICIVHYLHFTHVQGNYRMESEPPAIQDTTCTRKYLESENLQEEVLAIQGLDNNDLP